MASIVAQCIKPQNIARTDKLRHPEQRPGYTSVGEEGWGRWRSEDLPVYPALWAAARSKSRDMQR